ncbi:hypothetical protein GQ457_08G005710 [Hibiscus cannabinus]
MAENENGPLFETRPVKGRFVFKLFVASVAVGIGFICAYRLWFLPVASGKLHRWAWIGLFLCELWFGFYWSLTVICRWNPVYRFPYKNRLSQRYEKETLPGVDIFVCTADPSAEPPLMVMNTVLSVMAYDYPPEKLNIYLSDDGASDFTFYAMLEASSFSKQWLPFCRKLKVEPRSPEAYFKTAIEPDNHDPVELKHWLSIKKLYEEAKMRIETSRKMNKIPEDIKTDIEGNVLPTLVYLAREKRPQYHHHFKAGAMNALIRVSARISNGPIVLNVDCDMFSNDSDSIKDSLCVFMDHENGHEIAFVQYPQAFHNLTKNDLYGNSCRVFRKLEFPGFDANGGPCYIGTGCFHRRDALCGKKYDETCKVDWKRLNHRRVEESASVLEATCKVLASCSFEQNSPWGKEMGLKYGCPVEDIITGLSIQCRDWKSIFLDPERESFLGIAPTTLSTMLVQHKRWAEDIKPMGAPICICFHCTPSIQPWGIPVLLGYSKSAFVVTPKVADRDVSSRYEQELMEFDDSSPMFDVLASLAMLNLFGIFGVVKKLASDVDHRELSDRFGLQILLSLLLVALNWPVYKAMFYRKDKGRMPASVTYKSIIYALLVSTLTLWSPFKYL